MWRESLVSAGLWTSAIISPWRHYGSLTSASRSSPKPSPKNSPGIRLRRWRVLRQVPERRQERRYLLDGRPAKHIEVDVEVSVDQPIAHAGDLVIWAHGTAGAAA